MEITLDGRKVKAKSAATVAELLKQLPVNPEEVLVKVNGRLASNSAAISPNDEVKVMRVIYGG